MHRFFSSLTFCKDLTFITWASKNKLGLCLTCMCNTYWRKIFSRLIVLKTQGMLEFLRPPRKQPVFTELKTGHFFCHSWHLVQWLTAVLALILCSSSPFFLQIFCISHCHRYYLFFWLKGWMVIYSICHLNLFQLHRIVHTYVVPSGLNPA